ncbi:hypothetical protein SAMN06273570_2526 [Candidatus Pantoea floridensis]|uniref:Uncharacterized protein n=1 Tax=Candidatus Pantoea floridensis TaxID=1938870 RepID=A0A286BVI0_9GAMM|nr:hypothetical protein BX596_4893 [Enterobacteriaceae bacterium JKS000233]SOD38135.1 hypothetical protein SAMN06273570_2526 [Pantoea floridensis]
MIEIKKHCYSFTDFHCLFSFARLPFTLVRHFFKQGEILRCDLLVKYK